MPVRPPDSHFPTFSKLRRRLAGLDSFPRWHFRATILGILMIVALGAGFATVTIHERGLEERRANEFSILRNASTAETDLASIAAAHRMWQVTGQAAALAQFRRGCNDFRERMLEMVPLLRDDQPRRERVRRLAADFQHWMNEATHPSTAPRSLENPLFTGLYFSLSAFQRESEGLLQNSVDDARRHHLLATGAFVLCGMLSIGGLTVVVSSSFRGFRHHLAKANAAEAQVRAIFDNTLDGVITVDGLGIIQSVNPAAERIFAQRGTDLLGQNLSTLIPQRLFFHDMKEGSGTAVATMGQRQGYYPFPIEVSISAMEVAGKRQFVAIVRDVSERQRSEDALRQISIGVSTTTGEEFLRSLLKQLSKSLSNNFAFLVELAKVPSGMPRAGTLTVAEQGSIRSVCPYDLAHSACAEVLANGTRTHLAQVRTLFPEDVLLLDLSAESFVAVPLTDHRGEPVGLIGVLDRHALTDTQIIESTLRIFAARAGAEIERKRSADDLAAEKERLAVTLRSIADGFLTIGKDGRVLLMNSVAERLTGWSQAEAVGQPLGTVFQLLEERTRRPRARVLQRILDTGVAEGLEGPALLATPGGAPGTERLIEGNASPIRDAQHRRIGSIIIFRDVTERRQLEQEQQKADKLDSLGVVAGGIAHDFNNLLTTILGNLSLALVQPEVETGVSERVTAAKKAASRAQDLARQLLTFAKGGTPIKQTAAIPTLVRDTLRLTLQGSAVHCEYHLPDDELWPVEIDPGQISQVLSALALNAQQAMPAGGTLRVIGENLELPVGSHTLGMRPGRWVKLSLQDQGVGIPPEYFCKIFDPYFTTKPKNSGLGLATAYSIIKAHGGHIGVDSEPGAGSTFSICLPASDKPLTAAPPPPPQHVENNPRILVIDDEEAICMLVTCTLEPLGYEVTEACDGLSAITAYEKALREGRPYQLVISDLTMPDGLSGAQTIARLREIDPKVRAIVSSGYANDPVLSRFSDYGFCGMIAKPYEIDALARKVAETLAAAQEQAIIYHDFEQRKTA
jgi:PAS domain S-box-containing protein